MEMILPNNHRLYYSDLNDNNVVPSSSAPSNNTASSSVWSSASSTMCSPAAHAIQKLFSCSSNSLKLNHGNYSGIESKTFKTKSEILKKKSKFWKYLEGEANDKNRQLGIDSQKKMPTKSFKYKSNFWSKSYEGDDESQQDLSELLEYSCSLCDSCRCVDCQIGYFDCENSDDSNSEYSFHLSAYEEDLQADDSENENVCETTMELTHNCLQASCEYCCNSQSEIERNLATNSTTPACCVCNDLTCNKTECCHQCSVESNGVTDKSNVANRQEDR